MISPSSARGRPYLIKPPADFEAKYRLLKWLSERNRGAAIGAPGMILVLTDPEVEQLRADGYDLDLMERPK